jgi:hypothetical protein
VIPAGVRIWAAASPVDMRRGLIGLAEVARDQLSQDPGGGALFVFTNKRRDRLKLLWHDRTGLCLLYKALDRGFFRIPGGRSRTDERGHRPSRDGSDPGRRAASRLEGDAPKDRGPGAQCRLARRING